MFTLIFGIWFVVAGVVRFVVACSAEENRGATFALAALDLIAGVVILAWPELGLATLAVIIGITLIIRGMLLIAAGFGLRRVGHQPAAG